MKARLRNLALPIATFVAFIATWHGYVTAFAVPDYILPEPLEVAQAFVTTFRRGTIWPHLLFTVQCLAAGYAIGCAVAVALGAMVAEWRMAERCLYPYVIALQSMPKVALAPLLFVWFGFGAESKIVMVALICFFPVFVNTMVGIKQADPALVDVMRASAASRRQIFVHVKLPAAASSIFAGLQIAVVLGLIGALVAEFISTKLGLGRMITAAAADLNVGLILAIVVVLAALGLAGTALVRWLHRRIVFWEARRDGDINVEVY